MLKSFLANELIHQHLQLLLRYYFFLLNYFFFFFRKRQTPLLHKTTHHDQKVVPLFCGMPFRSRQPVALGAFLQIQFRAGAFRFRYRLGCRTTRYKKQTSN